MSHKLPFSLKSDVEKRKDQALKIKLDTLRDNLGIPITEFYERAKITRAYWYRLSWGLDEFPHWLKLHLFREFGDSFAFLFDSKLGGANE